MSTSKGVCFFREYFRLQTNREKLGEHLTVITFERRVQRALQHFDLNALRHALAVQMAAAACA